jgi:putative transposase
MMPNDLPPWQTVYDHFSRWSKRGVWELVLDQLNRKARSKVGKSNSPSYGIIDAQSVKTQYAINRRVFFRSSLKYITSRFGIANICCMNLNMK